MTPLDGILGPTLGAFHLGTTLIFPFVAIAALSQDRDSGAMKLVLQWPLNTGAIVAVKFVAAVIAWCLASVVFLSALVDWHFAGGHLSWLETTNLMLGHLLYAVVVIGIGLLAAALTSSAASAAVVALAFTLGFWVLDFASASNFEGLGRLARLAPTAALREFERGLWSWPHALALLGSGLGFAFLACVWLEPVRTRATRLLRSSVVVLAMVALLTPTIWARAGVDVSEDRRNSFSLADEAALRRMTHGLTIRVHLTPEDSRAQELSGNVLAKLQRLVPALGVQWVYSGTRGAFAAAGSDRYGLIELSYFGQHRETRSNSPREILPLLHELSGARIQPDSAPIYTGYPLVADPRRTRWWFYFVLPTLIMLGGWYARTRRHTYSDLILTQGEAYVTNRTGDY
jgi:hypothetical protein